MSKFLNQSNQLLAFLYNLSIYVLKFETNDDQRWHRIYNITCYQKRTATWIRIFSIHDFWEWIMLLISWKESISSVGADHVISSQRGSPILFSWRVNGHFALREAWIKIYFFRDSWIYNFPSSGNWFSIFSWSVKYAFTFSWFVNQRLLRE